MPYPKSIENLIIFFSKLPSVGPKTAERYVFFLLKQNPEYLQSLAQSIAELKEKTTVCSSCFAISDNSPCSICSDSKRNSDIICVAANTKDMLAVENAKEYNGKYHILGGVINTIEGTKPESLKINELIEKVKKNNIKEIIFALSSNIEGETTALYLKKILSPFKLKITRIARGLPSGAELEYADEITLASALKFRNEI
ncbi:MAG: recombination mediator RecR [Patescibacteria group bacterium]|nr:recombination mediator RecR [Patescibacteria group bacterium]